jgi:hypothetical protein
MLLHGTEISKEFNYWNPSVETFEIKRKEFTPPPSSPLPTAASTFHPEN